jgi:glycosyltransferase involved in cell wall biosynthesis
MYPLDRGMWGATVRISHLRDELARLTELDVVAGYRGARRWALLRYAFGGRLRGLDGIYVENSTTLPSETDIAFLALARALGIPVLVYVRDAQYLFAEYYVARSPKRWLARAAFMPAIRLLRSVASRVAYPSSGLAAATGDRAAHPLLLPPGAPRPMEVPRSADARTLLFVGGMRYPVHGYDLLVDAVERVRSGGDEVEVVCVARPGEEPPEPRPLWLKVVHGAADEIRALLPETIATIQPRRRSPYNDLAVPIKVMEYLAYGRPLIVTDCTEQARIVSDADAGVVARDVAEDLADGIRRVVRATPGELDGWSANAHAAAAANGWDERARRVVDILGAR